MTIDIDEEKLDLLRAYNRNYYHTHKQESDCEFCGKTYSSKSALVRHQQRNLKCQIQQLRNKTQGEASTTETNKIKHKNKY
jgi:hypothetical protein